MTPIQSDSVKGWGWVPKWFADEQQLTLTFHTNVATKYFT